MNEAQTPTVYAQQALVFSRSTFFFSFPFLVLFRWRSLASHKLLSRCLWALGGLCQDFDQSGFTVPVTVSPGEECGSLKFPHSSKVSLPWCHLEFPSKLLGEDLKLAFRLKGLTVVLNAMRREMFRGRKGRFPEISRCCEMTSPSWAVMGRSFSSKSGTDSPSGICGDFCTWLKNSTTAEVLLWTPACSEGRQKKTRTSASSCANFAKAASHANVMLSLWLWMFICCTEALHNVVN